MLLHAVNNDLIVAEKMLTLQVIIPNHSIFGGAAK